VVRWNVWAEQVARPCHDPASMYTRMNGSRRISATEHVPRDEDLMRQVAEGSEEALALLHRRFARLIFGLAVRTLDRAAAEDLVQDVFLAVWSNAGQFDPERGTVRAWVLQIAHFRLLNELRRQSRQPEIAPDPDGLMLAGLPGRDPGPLEATWRQHRHAVLTSALDELPPPQREALRLAFLDDLTHEQVAAELGLPLGTAKTRIRVGLQKLRDTLAPRWAALAALCLLAALGVRYGSERATSARYDRALSMVTASDSVNLRLAPLPGTPEKTHARYRGRPGAGIAVVTLSAFPAAPAAETYQAWARHGGTWTSLGTVEPDAGGSARLIAENPALAALPDGLEVTLEPGNGSASPSERVIVAWTP
jgi:RNA polymerase sigma factor (sigma-70 family)